MGAYDYKPAAPPAPKQPVKQDAPPPPVTQDGGSATTDAPSGLASLLGLSRDPQTGVLGWQFPGAQRFHDILNRTENNFLLNTADPITSKVAQTFDPSNPAANLPALRVQRAQMNQQMPTVDKATADALGQINPTMFLRSIPAVGPIVQGAVQEGVKGWAQGENQQQIEKNALIGAGGGLASGAVSSPQAMGQAVATGVTSGVPAALGWLYGGKDKDLMGGYGGEAGAAAGAAAGKAYLDPWAQSIQKAVSSAPPWATDLGSYAPLVGASYWNQDQRDRSTLAGQ